MKTLTFICEKDYTPLSAGVGHVIKITESSSEELDKDTNFKGWRKYFREISEQEEYSISLLTQ